MDTNLVVKTITRRKPLVDSDINKFDEEEVEYYIYDGFDMLTRNQSLILLNKAKQLKIEKGDIEYLTEQIQESNEIEEENNISEINEDNNSGGLFAMLNMFFFI